MKKSAIVALYALSAIVEGTWWIAIAQPIILSLGTVLTAINMDVLNLDIQTIELRNWLPLDKQQKEIIKQVEKAK